MRYDFLLAGIRNRGGGIRTHDPSVPNAVRYQTALRPDMRHIIAANHL